MFTPFQVFVLVPVCILIFLFVVYIAVKLGTYANLRARHLFYQHHERDRNDDPKKETET